MLRKLGAHHRYVHHRPDLELQRYVHHHGPAYEADLELHRYVHQDHRRNVDHTALLSFLTFGRRMYWNIHIPSSRGARRGQPMAVYR